ncbi:Stp1/IreP family PP2C-type Ser/Thr phosphatase [Collinsella tanakaei]|uniref:Stp1/IreP family PP2C-type Ser/Thr phosphatase n=1 Tax=Collinsella tanakaei TaxID=626935 RepID=UPI002F94E208
MTDEENNLTQRPADAFDPEPADELEALAAAHVASTLAGGPHADAPQEDAPRAERSHADRSHTEHSHSEDLFEASAEYVGEARSIPGFLEAAAGPVGKHAAPAEDAAPSSAAGSTDAVAGAASSVDAADAADAARAAAPAAHTPQRADEDEEEAQAETSPADTAEIDVAAVEAKLKDPGSTQSFAPITDDLIDADSTYDAGTTTQLMWGARSDVGCVRSHNEDSYLVQSPLFCVCDGMGGHAAGEVASSIAVETIAKTAPHTADPALLGAAIEAANAAVIEAALNGLGKPGMGCTATAAYIEGNTIAIAHVGDSRAYLLHEGTLIRVTRDHSYVEELVDAGEITADEARVHPNRSVITRALGSDPAMYADHFSLNIEEGDRLILCSDGLSSMIPDGEIENIATQSSTAQICTDNLVDAALAAGGSDNCTVVVVDVVDDGKLREISKRRRRNVIAVISAVVALLALIGVIALASVANSVYLGVKDDAVAIYKGVPNKVMDFELHWLEDETSVMLSDLPEDTQNRLREGIPQKSVEAAAKTVSKYREQIDEDQSKQIQDANVVRSGVEADSGSAIPGTASSGDVANSVSSSAENPTSGGDAQ